MNNYCLTMWAEEPIRCSECGKDIGWERVSIEQTPVKIVSELLRRDIGIKEGETTADNKKGLSAGGYSYKN